VRVMRAHLFVCVCVGMCALAGASTKRVAQAAIPISSCRSTAHSKLRFKKRHQKAAAAAAAIDSELVSALSFPAARATPLASVVSLDVAMTRFLAQQQTLSWDTPHDLLFTFAVLWLEQVHSKQSVQAPIAEPHGDSGLKAPERIAGHEVDAPLVPCSQRARKWRQRQLAKLRSATNVAAAADLQPVSALSKLAAVSLQVSVGFDSPCSVAVLRSRPSFAEARRFRATLPSHMCRLPCIRLKRAAPNPIRASHQARVTPACPRSTGARGRTLTMRTMEVTSNPLIRYSLQHATYNTPISTSSLQASPSKMQEVPHSTCNNLKHDCSHATYDSLYVHSGP